MTLSASLVGIGMAQAIVYLLFIRFVDLYERESLLYVIPVFVWGFTVAVVFSGIFNTIAQVTLSALVDNQVASFLTAVFVAPPVEESIKGLALLLIFLVSYLVGRRRGTMEFSGVMDGIVYGSAVGFGFAIAEDILYGLQFGPETFIARRIFGGFAHAAFTSLTGVGIGLIPWVRSGFLKVILPLTGLFGAMLMHALFNFTASIFGPVAYVVLFFVLLVYVVLIFIWLAVERRTIRYELRDEVDSGLISSHEYAILPTYFRRTGYYLSLIFTGHLRTWRRARKAHAAAVDLAFAKRLAYSSHAGSQQIRLRKLRERMASLRAATSSSHSL